ncbi:MAG: hypothetical protein ABI112_16795 [Terracoccus sp.]
MLDLHDRPARLAVELLRQGARFVIVGGTARRLFTGRGTPRDLDVVVDAPDLPRFVTALAGLGAHTSVTILGRAAPSHVATSWGPLDVFVGTSPSGRGVLFKESWLVVVPASAAA